MSKLRNKPVTKDQIADWAENPVTIELLSLCEQELSDIRETSVVDCFYPGDPQKTQENLVELEARERFWESWIAALSGDWTYFEEEEDE